MNGLDATRIRAVVRKELRDYRRKRAIVVTMAVLPILFLIEPVVTIFVAPPAASGGSLSKDLVLPILYLLLIPTVMPSTLAAYTVAGAASAVLLVRAADTTHLEETLNRIREADGILRTQTSIVLSTLFERPFALAEGASEPDEPALS